MHDKRTRKRTARRCQRWASLTLGLATLTLACHPAVDTPGVPLYPNGATTPLPRNQIAQVAGPIAQIDGKDVVGQGGLFDLLPGCHIVELERRLRGEGYALSSGAYWSGQFPITIYALHMKAGARYVIRREIDSDGQSGRVILSAREEEASGATADLSPAKSAGDIKACRQ
jgi:hypothetical protein